MSDCFRKAGVDTTLEKKLSEIRVIEISDGLKVVLHPYQGEEKVMLEGPSDLIAGVEIRQEGNVLQLRDNNRCRFRKERSKEFRIHLWAEQPQEMRLYDASEVSCSDTLHIDSLYIDQSSIGDQHLLLNVETMELHQREAGAITLEGNCGVLIAVNYDTGPLKAARFPTDYAFLFHYGLENMQVAPLSVMEARVSNRGNILYYTDPSLRLDIKITGAGQVIRK